MLISCFGMDLTVPGTFRITLVDKRKVQTPLPEAIQKFLAEFDEGRHPELEMSVTEQARIAPE